MLRSWQPADNEFLAWWYSLFVMLWVAIAFEVLDERAAGYPHGCHRLMRQVALLALMTVGGMFKPTWWITFGMDVYE